MHYLVYKNGAGNSWNHFTERSGSRDGTHHLNFGNWSWFKNSDGPAAEVPTFPRLAAVERPFNEAKYDLRHLLTVAHPANREQFALLVFDEQYISVWQIVGEVELHREDSRLWELMKECHRTGGRAFASELELSKGNEAEPSWFRTIPVRRLARIQRADLFTGIDSLGSYQYLIQGTCRPLWRARGNGDPVTDTVRRALCVDSDEGLAPFRLHDWSEEQAFGAIARLLLNQAAGLQPSMSAAMKKVDSVEHQIGWEEVALSLYNPILVETAALALVLDLGLTPDIGIGKAKDVVDVRARAANHAGRFCSETAETAAKRLSGLIDRDCMIGEMVIENLREHGVLDIQCKAAKRDDIPLHILYFGIAGPRGRGVSPTKLWRVASQAKSCWPNYSRSVRMQAAMLEGAWRIGSGTNSAE